MAVAGVYRMNQLLRQGCSYVIGKSDGRVYDPTLVGLNRPKSALPGSRPSVVPSAMDGSGQI